MWSNHQAAAFCRTAGGACCLSRRGDWWTRLATNLVHLKRKNEALEQVGIEVCEVQLEPCRLPQNLKPERSCSSWGVHCSLN